MEPSLGPPVDPVAPHPATTPEVVSEFVERSTETTRGSDVSESPAWIVTLLDAPVVLLLKAPCNKMPSQRRGFPTGESLNSSPPS